MNELKELENEIDTLVNDFRKTCFIVKDNGLDKDKSIELMALGMINIKNTLTRLITTYTAKKELEARIDELQVIDYIYHGNVEMKTEVSTKDLFKGGVKFIAVDDPDSASIMFRYIQDRLTQLSSQLTNNKKEV